MPDPKHVTTTDTHQLLLNLMKDHKNTEILTMMEKFKISNKIDSFESTLLHYAAEYGSDTLVKYFLDNGWKIDAQNRDGSTPLMLSVKEKHMKIVDILLNANADIEIHDASNKNVFHLLMDTKPCTEIVMKFVRHLEEKYKDEALGSKLYKLDCPLPHAIFLKNTKVTEQMLKLGSSVNATVNKKYTALHVAASLADLSNIELLIKHGADINFKDEFQRSPLSYFLFSKYVNMMEFEPIYHSLASETSLTTPDTFGLIPLFAVVARGNKHIVKIILEMNIGLSFRDKRGRSFLHSLLENRDPDVFEQLDPNKVDINVVDCNGLSPLHMASINGSVNVVQFLIMKGADLKIKTKTIDQLTALELAKRRDTLLPSENVKKCIKMLEAASSQSVT